MADNDTRAQHLTPETRDLLKALSDLLDVPMYADYDDREAWLVLSHDRLGSGKVMIDSLLNDPDAMMAVEITTRAIRTRLADMPVTYPVKQAD
jgi:hypothetical protein